MPQPSNILADKNRRKNKRCSWWWRESLAQRCRLALCCVVWWIDWKSLFLLWQHLIIFCKSAWRVPRLPDPFIHWRNNNLASNRASERVNQATKQPTNNSLLLSLQSCCFSLFLLVAFGKSAALWTTLHCTGWFQQGIRRRKKTIRSAAAQEPKVFIDSYVLSLH